MIFAISPIFWQLGASTFFPPRNYEVISAFYLSSSRPLLITEDFESGHQGYLIIKFNPDRGTPDLLVLGPDGNPIEISEVVYYDSSTKFRPNQQTAWIEFTPKEDGIHTSKISLKTNSQQIENSIFGHFNPEERKSLDLFSFSKESNILIVILLSPLTYLGVFVIVLGKSSKTNSEIFEFSRFQRPKIYISIVVIAHFFFLYVIFLGFVDNFYEFSTHSSGPDELNFEAIGWGWFGVYFFLIPIGFALAGIFELSKFNKLGFNIIMFTLPFLTIPFAMSLALIVSNPSWEFILSVLPIPLLFYIPLILGWKKKVLDKKIL